MGAPQRPAAQLLPALLSDPEPAEPCNPGRPAPPPPKTGARLANTDSRSLQSWTGSGDGPTRFHRPELASGATSLFRGASAVHHLTPPMLSGAASDRCVQRLTQ